MMEQLFNYIATPGAIINLIVFVFGLGVTYSSITSRIKELERRVTKIEDLDLDSRLTKMQIDLDWIKKTLDELKKKK